MLLESVCHYVKSETDYGVVREGNGHWSSKVKDGGPVEVKSGTQ